jgi:hypothetical protein
MGPTLTCSFDHATVVEEELEAVVGMEEVPSGGLREERSRETEPVHELRHHRWVVRRRGRCKRASWPCSSCGSSALVVARADGRCGRSNSPGKFDIVLSSGRKASEPQWRGSDVLLIAAPFCQGRGCRRLFLPEQRARQERQRFFHDARGKTVIFSQALMLPTETHH